MKIKHKCIKEFQYLSPDKKIFILKLGTILNEYVYNVKGEDIKIDREVLLLKMKIIDMIYILPFCS